MSHITIHAIGKSRAHPEYQRLAESYLKRLPWRVGVHEWEVKKNLEGEARKQAESKLLLEACTPDSHVIALDIQGKTLTSEALAKHMEKQTLHSRPVIFLIGGAHGFDDTIRNRADLLLSFGSCTWPHMLVRVMLLEQLYRSYSILHHHPYHK